MRNESGFSHQPTSRAARLVVLVSTIGIVLIAAWGFAPFLFANSTQTIAAVAPPRGIATQRVMAPAMAAAPEETAAATLEQPSPPPVPAPIFATASVPPVEATTALAARWSNAGVLAEPPSSATPGQASTKPIESVPLPHKRPSLTIAARLAIPLPRPRPEIEAGVARDELSALDLDVQRQR